MKNIDEAAYFEELYEYNNEDLMDNIEYIKQKKRKSDRNSICNA